MKKVLVITHDFPPIGKGSVLRPLKFCKYFKNYGWEPIVLTSTPKTYYFADYSLLKEAEEQGITIFRTKGSSNNLLTGRNLKPLPNESSRKLKLKLKRLRKLPDEHKSWISKAEKLGKEIIENHNIEIIYSTGPSFTAHIAAGKLKEKYKIPLVIDYQDSWLHSSTISYHKGYKRLRAMKLEQDVIRVADEIITSNRRIKEYLIQEYNYLKHKDINIIHHGYDEDDFIIAQESVLPEKTKMRFLTAGNFFDLITPKYFLHALKIAFDKQPELRGKIEAVFLGGISKENLKYIQEYNIADSVINPGYIEHISCIKYMLSSDVLWFMIGRGKGDDTIAPVRLAEYFRAKKPILACIPDGAAKQILRGYEAVRIAPPDDAEEISKLILEFYELYTNKMMPAPNEEIIAKFNVNKLTYNLVRYFEFLRDISPEFGIKKIENY